ncbi:MAG: LptF/LptG family permease [Planctomycetia bacterium]|nr:LptF/LptG family permease [Planctomycetia bacterium]
MFSFPYFTIIDRYFVARYLWNFTLCLFVGLAIFLVFDCFPKIDDIFELFQKKGIFFGAITLVQYYFIHTFYILRLVGGIPVLVGATLALYSLEKASNLNTRGGEVIPVLTSGFSRWRIAIPFMYTGFFLIIILTLIQECFLPLCKNWPGASNNSYLEKSHNAFTQRDLLTGISFQGDSLDLEQGEIGAPRFIIPSTLATKNVYIVGESAEWYPSPENHSSGYLIKKIENFGELKNFLREHPVFLPQKDFLSQSTVQNTFSDENAPTEKDTKTIMSEKNSQNTSKTDSSEKIILTSEDADWIKSDEIFFCTNISPSSFIQQKTPYVPLSLLDLWDKIKKPSTDYQLHSRIEIHSRILKPFLDMSLLLLSLPIILSGRFRSKFFISVILIFIILSYIIIPGICTFLGNHGDVSPLMAAWLPIFIFYSVAAVLFAEFYT